MKTQSNDYRWVVVFGLIIMALITAVALADENRQRRSSRQRSRPTDSETPAATQRERPTAPPTATPSRRTPQAPSQRPSRSLFRSNTAPQTTAAAQADTRRSVTTRSRPAERAVERSQERTLERLRAPRTSAADLRTAVRRPDTSTQQPTPTTTRTIRRRVVTPDRQTATPTADVTTDATAQRPDRSRTVERIGRPARRTPTTTASQQTTDARPDGFVYRGSAWYERNRDRTTDDSGVERRSRSDSGRRSEGRRTASDRVTRLTGSRDSTTTLATARTREDDGVERVSRLSGSTDRRSRSSSIYSSETHSSDTRTRSHRPSRRRSSQVVINGDNNVVVQGDVTVQQTRPYIPPRRVTSISYIHTSPHWRSYGSSFVFRWSNRSCGVVAVVPHYDDYGVTYYYPRYHRRFVFVSLGGYWPSYRYVRYYWYGAHPYYWYGPHVTTAPVTRNTYNTYNTYNTHTSAPQSTRPSTTYAVGGDYQFDPAEDDFSDVRQRLAAEQQAIDAPYFQTAADLAFENAVKLFEAGNFDDASRQFLEAIEQSPDDSILPFTYAQALFASGSFADAAEVLRAAMARIPEDEPTVYYPRGLYDDEAALTAQVADLKAALARQPDNADYQLLLGYQFLGLGELDDAVALLTQAGGHEPNAEATTKLLNLIELLQTTE